MRSMRRGLALVASIVIIVGGIVAVVTNLVAVGSSPDDSLRPLWAAFFVLGVGVLGLWITTSSISVPADADVRPRSLLPRAAGLGLLSYGISLVGTALVIGWRRAELRSTGLSVEVSLLLPLLIGAAFVAVGAIGLRRRRHR